LIESLISGPEEVDGDVYTWFTSPGYPQYAGPRVPLPQTDLQWIFGALSDTEQIVFTFSSPIARTYTINVMIKAGRFVEPLLYGAGIHPLQREHRDNVWIRTSSSGSG
jgi:hypothetical protein